MVEGSGVDLIVVLSERAWSSSKFFIRQAPWRMRPFYRVLGAGLMARAARLDACAPAPHLADKGESGLCGRDGLNESGRRDAGCRNPAHGRAVQPRATIMQAKPRQHLYTPSLD